MNKKGAYSTSVPVLALALAAVTCGEPPITNGGDGGNGGPERIGTVSRETDTIEHGASRDSLEQVLGSNDLFEGDFLQVRDNGEGVIDFGDRMRVRLFNDTTLGITRAEAAPGTPLDVRLYLEEGGMTAELEEGQGQAVITTPGGTEITVLGTQFFVIYDDTLNLTAAGCFDGSVVIESAGSQVSLNDGETAIAPDNHPPSSPSPFSESMVQFEQLSRSLASPVDAANQTVPDLGDDVVQTSPPEETQTRTLIAFEDGELLPDLAESWSVSDDGSTLTLFLREGLALQDGTEFNAIIVEEALYESGLAGEGGIMIETIDDVTIALVVDIIEPGSPNWSYDPAYDSVPSIYEELSFVRFNVES
jgi:hypothetical protein